MAYFFQLNRKTMLKHLLLPLLLCCSAFVKAQKIEHIYVDLYTDSLKKGTYNYINIDGQLPNGKYIPLDSTQVFFWASAGKFSGNSLWIDKNFREEKVDFKVTLRKDQSLHKEFTIFIKKQPDPELKSADELMREMQNRGKTKRGKG